MNIRRNIVLFKLNCFFSDLWPLSALAIVYFEQITHSYASALGVFAVANVVQSFAEVPTGLLSDKIGRKYTMVTASAIIILSFSAFAGAGNVSSMELLYLGGILWGIAEAFNSGADDALMYETMQQLRKERKYDIVYAQSKMFSQLGLATGALIAAVATYFYSLNVLAWLAAILSSGQLIVNLFLIEPHKQLSEPQNSLRCFFQAVKNIMKSRKLRLLALIQIIGNGIGYSAHRLEGVYFNLLIPTWLVNITRIIKQLTGVLSFWMMPRFRRLGFYKILVLSAAGNVIIRTIGLLLNNVSSPFIMSCVNLFYGTEVSSQSALLQKEFSAGQRATMGSIVSLVGGLLSAGIYYMVGTVADKYSVYYAMASLIVGKAFMGGAYTLMLRKYAA